MSLSVCACFRTSLFLKCAGQVFHKISLTCDVFSWSVWDLGQGDFLLPDHGYGISIWHHWWGVLGNSVRVVSVRFLHSEIIPHVLLESLEMSVFRPHTRWGTRIVENLRTCVKATTHIKKHFDGIVLDYARMLLLFEKSLPLLLPAIRGWYLSCFNADFSIPSFRIYCAEICPLHLRVCSVIPLYQ